MSRPRLIGSLAPASGAFACSACRCESPVRRERCPRCLSWGTFAELGEGGIDAPEAWAPKRLRQIKTDRVSRVKLGDPALDLFFDGGPIRSGSYLYTAGPGFGKTTWSLQAISFFQRPLYVTSEQTEGELKLKAAQLKVEHPMAEFVATPDLLMVAKNITDEYDAVIYDSAQCFVVTDESRAAAGSVQQVSLSIALMHDMAKKLGHVAFIINQHNKEGDAQGAMTNQHQVTGTIFGKKGSGARRYLWMEKHRHGKDSAQLGKFIACDLTDAGLDHFTLIDRDEALAEGATELWRG